MSSPMPPSPSPASERFDAQATAWAGVTALEACSSRRFAPHTHDQFGVGLILAGAQQSASGRGTVRAGPGHLITVNPNEVHDGQALDGRARHWRMLYLDPDLVARVLGWLELPAQSELAHPVLLQAGAAQLFLRLHQALLAPAAQTDELPAQSLLTELLARLSGPARAQPARICASVLRVRELIDDCPEAALGLPELAHLAGLSPYHLLRAFKAGLGLPPHAYRLQRRLHKARALIAAGERLAEVAAACGFADQSHLHRHFVRAYGLRPGALAALHGK